jgi:hypothetical protein
VAVSCLPWPARRWLVSAAEVAEADRVGLVSTAQARRPARRWASARDNGVERGVAGAFDFRFLARARGHHEVTLQAEEVIDHRWMPVQQAEYPAVAGRLAALHRRRADA